MPASPLTRIVTRPVALWTVCLGLLAVAYVAKLSERPLKTEQRMEERTAEGKSNPVKFYTEVYWWWGAWPGLAICLLLIASGKWITRPLSPNFDPGSGSAPPGYAKQVALAATAAIALAAWLNSPRLSLSLWDDEEYVMRKYIVGSYDRDIQSGAIDFDQPTWIETMFDARRPTNHTLYSTAARLAHSFHSRGTGPRDPYFSEPLLRLPAFLAGLAALGSIAWCLHTFGFHRAAMLAPFALLSHAWFTRLGVDTRGYAIVLFAAPAAFACLALAIRTGRWRWWSAFAAAQFTLFFGYNGSLYILAALNLTALALLWGRHDTSPLDRRTILFRYLGASALLALAAIFCFLPCLPQITKFFEGSGFFQMEMPLRWWQNLAAYLLAGVPWFDDEPGNPLDYHLAAIAPAVWLAFAIFAAALLAGIIRFARSPHRAWLITLLLPLPLLIAHNYLSGRHVIHWYASIALPGLLVLASAGAAYPAQLLKGPSAKCAFYAAALLLIASIGGPANRMNLLLRSHSFVPLRESVHATGIAVTNPLHPDFDKGTITVSFHQPSLAYDPGLWLFSDPATNAHRLRELLARADAENRPLYVNLGLADQARIIHPDAMALVDNPNLFEPVETLYGLFGASIRNVFRYRPGTLDILPHDSAP